MINRVHAKSLKFRYADELQKYKADRIMNILGECRAIKLIKIIADTKRVHYAYLRWFINVKPKTKRM
jgi:Zn-finger domain-containing protein